MSVDTDLATYVALCIKYISHFISYFITRCILSQCIFFKFCNHVFYPTAPLSSLLLLSSIISTMMRLLLDVSICFCPTPEPLLVVQSTSMLPYLLLHCPPISSIAFLGFFPHWYSSVMLLLAVVSFLFMIHARTHLVFALLFGQTVSFLDIQYHTQCHFSSCHVLLLLIDVISACSVLTILQLAQMYCINCISHFQYTTGSHYSHSTVPRYCPAWQLSVCYTIALV